VTLICLNTHISVFGDTQGIPYWTLPEEQQPRELVEQGKPIEELCEIFKRTPEALRLKLKRLGVAVPETLKEVKTTTTPQQTLSPPALNTCAK
jgi:hypothetical protein